jgi:hypothetical protein
VASGPIPKSVPQEHAPEKWKPVFRKVMLKQRDVIMMRFHLIAS